MVDVSTSRVFVVTLLSICNCVFPCQITIEGTSPLLTKDFGTKTIVFKSREEILNLEEGETISLFCKGIQVLASTRTDAYHNYASTIPSIEDNVTFFCVSENILINQESYQYVQVSCPPNPRLSLYESSIRLPNCGNYTNYALGFKLRDAGDEVIKAGVCYDLERLELKFVSYVAYDKKVLVFNKMEITNELSLNLNEKLDGFNKYFDFVSQSSGNKQSATKSVFNAKEFDFESLLQDEALKKDLENFSYIFDTLWWRQLRQENWRFFLDALNERTQTVKYVVNVGTFGNVTIPAMNGNCSSLKKEIFTKSTADVTVKAPGYIWAYLRSITTGVDEEFVVIGHNSPYKKNPDHSEFCATDICDDIEWLRNREFGSLRYLPTLGYTFCCRPEEVAKVVDYFPLHINEITTTPNYSIADLMFS